MSDLLNKMTNIEMVDGKSVSLSKILLIFYMFVAGNYTANLLSKQIKKKLENDRLAQHIVGLLALLVLINIAGNVSDLKLSVLYAVIVYAWFIFTTKLDMQINIIILCLLGLSYVYENKIDSDVLKRHKILTDDEKNVLVGENNTNKSYITLVIILVTLIGTFVYNDKKIEQYGGGYDMFRYLLY